MGMDKVGEEMKKDLQNQSGGFLVPTVIEEPINKWQAFKQRRFPYWLQRIFPVKTKKIPCADLLREALRKAWIDSISSPIKKPKC